MPTRPFAIVVLFLLSALLTWNHASGQATPAPAPEAVPPAGSPPPAAAPATPTSAPASRPRREAVIPAGFSKIEVDGRVALVEPADEAWVRQAMTGRPATQPVAANSILQKLTQNRDAIVKQVAADLAIADANAVGAKFDEDVLKPAQSLANLRPPVLYLVCNGDRLRDLVKGGWQDPNFYYNRAADAVVRGNAVGLRADGPMDDSVIGAVYAPNAKPEDKAKALGDTISETEKDLTGFIDGQAKSNVGLSFARLINDVALSTMQLKPDQQWFGVGIQILLASRYSAPVTDQPLAELIKAMTIENPRNPLRASSVNLLHPPNPDSINPDAVPYYLDTVRRKSATAMQKVIDKSGVEVIPQIITAYREQKPADGAALVKIIADKTGIDLTNDLSK
jgi:hypothetical protein